MRTYAKLNASIMLIVWLCVYPWVFLVWAGIPTAATKHNFNGVLVCFILALIGCGVGTLVAVVLTIVWLVQRAPLYTKSRRGATCGACYSLHGISGVRGCWYSQLDAGTSLHGRTTAAPSHRVAECPRAADAPWPTYMTFADPGCALARWPKKKYHHGSNQIWPNHLHDRLWNLS